MRPSTPQVVAPPIHLVKFAKSAFLKLEDRRHLPTLAKLPDELAFAKRWGDTLVFSAGVVSNAPELPVDEVADTLESTHGSSGEGASTSTPYESPLLNFRSYRWLPGILRSDVQTESFSLNHALDPHRPACPFELRGTCKDPKCAFQSLTDARLSTSEMRVRNAAKPRQGSSEAVILQMSMVAPRAERSRQPLPPEEPVPDYAASSATANSTTPCSAVLAPAREVDENMSSKYAGGYRYFGANSSASAGGGVGASLVSAKQLEEKVNADRDNVELLLSASLTYLRLAESMEASSSSSSSSADAEAVKESGLRLLARGLNDHPSKPALWVAFLQHHVRNGEKGEKVLDDFAREKCGGSYDVWMKLVELKRTVQEKVQTLSDCVQALMKEPVSRLLRAQILDAVLQRLRLLASSQDLDRLRALLLEFVESLDGMGPHAALLTLLHPMERAVLLTTLAQVQLLGSLPTEVLLRLGHVQSCVPRLRWSESDMPKTREDAMVKESVLNAQRFLRSAARSLTPASEVIAQGHFDHGSNEDGAIASTFRYAREAVAESMIHVAWLLEGSQTAKALCNWFEAEVSVVAATARMRASLNRSSGGGGSSSTSKKDSDVVANGVLASLNRASQALAKRAEEPVVRLALIEAASIAAGVRPKAGKTSLSEQERTALINALSATDDSTEVAERALGWVAAAAMESLDGRVLSAAGMLEHALALARAPVRRGAGGRFQPEVLERVWLEYAAFSLDALARGHGGCLTPTALLLQCAEASRDTVQEPLTTAADGFTNAGVLAGLRECQVAPPAPEHSVALERVALVVLPSLPPHERAALTERLVSIAPWVPRLAFALFNTPPSPERPYAASWTLPLLVHALKHTHPPAPEPIWMESIKLSCSTKLGLPTDNHARAELAELAVRAFPTSVVLVQYACLALRVLKDPRQATLLEEAKSRGLVHDIT